MMLQALMAYAERRSKEDQCFADPDFQHVDVTWKILLDGGGHPAADPMCLLQKDGKRWRPRRLRRPFTSVNEISVRSLDKAKAYFLCDTLERALLYSEEEEKSDDPLTKARHRYFKELLGEAAKDGACVGEIKALLAFLDDEESVTAVRKALAMAAPKAKSEQNVAFEVGGVDLLKAEPLITFWRRKRAHEEKDRGERQVCLVTGVLAPTVETTEKIKGIGGQDTNLISANEKAFWSYGLEKAKNSPISLQAEFLTRAALNELISHGLSIGAVKYLHWTREAADDPFDLLETPDETRVAALLKAPWSGTPQSEIGSNRYFLLAISGNGARIVVREWVDSALPEVENNVRNWFEHLTITKEREPGMKSAFSISSFLKTLVRSGEIEKVPPQLPAQMLHAALTGGGLPPALLAAAVNRQNLRGESKELPARLALIKLYLVRNYSTDPRERKAMSDQLKQLDPNSTDIAYLCGQLFAVIGRLQLIALGKIGTSLSERTYGGVATRPASTLGPIFSKVPAYLKKANSRFPGAGTNKQKEIESLCARIDAVNKSEGRLGLPQVLSLEEQGRFALGYYCQLAQYRADRQESKIEEEADQVTDDAA